jgi:hypothetical protein
MLTILNWQGKLGAIWEGKGRASQQVLVLELVRGKNSIADKQQSTTESRYLFPKNEPLNYALKQKCIVQYNFREM